VRANAAASAIAFARRKRIGPYARETVERTGQEKHLAAMLRAGHALDLSRRIVRMAPGEDVEGLIVPEWD
jgi:regulatory protein